VSARLGNPQLITAPAAALGSAAGRSIALNTAGWSMLISAVLTYVATATVGGRSPAIRIVDAAGNIVWQDGNSGATLTAGLTFRLTLGTALGSRSTGAPVFLQTYLIPDGLSIPPGSSLVVLDGVNVDVNDTVQLNSLIISL